MSNAREVSSWVYIFFFQAEDGIRYLVRSRGLGDVYKRQTLKRFKDRDFSVMTKDDMSPVTEVDRETEIKIRDCLLYTSDAADERSSVDLGGRRIIKKKKEI